MARPLPKDVELQIAHTAKRSEIRSVAVFAFILGGIAGFGVAASIFSEMSNSKVPFLIVAFAVASFWAFSVYRRKKK